MKKEIINSSCMVYIQENEKLALINQPNRTKAIISSYSYTEPLECICNASLFFQDGTTTWVLGRNQGFDINGNRVDDRPEQEEGKAMYGLAINPNGDYKIGLLSSWEYESSNFSYSPKFVLINKGVIVNLTSTALSGDGYTIDKVNNYTYFGKLKNRKYFVVAAKSMSPQSVGELISSKYNVEFLICNDGGGSAQINLSGNIEFNPDGSERPVPNVIGFYRASTPPTPPPTTGTRVLPRIRFNSQDIRRAYVGGRILDKPMYKGKYEKEINVTNFPRSLGAMTSNTATSNPYVKSVTGSASPTKSKDNWYSIYDGKGSEEWWNGYNLDCNLGLTINLNMKPGITFKPTKITTQGPGFDHCVHGTVQFLGSTWTSAGSHNVPVERQSFMSQIPLYFTAPRLSASDSGQKTGESHLQEVFYDGIIKQIGETDWQDSPNPPEGAKWLPGYPVKKYSTGNILYWGLYDINYITGPGSLNSNNDTYVWGNGLSELPVPTVFEGQFVDWRSDKALTEIKENISKKEHKDLTLYANYEKSKTQYRVNYGWTTEEGGGGSTFPARTSTPDKSSWPYNLGSAGGKDGGAVSWLVGQCTWYCACRCAELTGKYPAKAGGDGLGYFNNAWIGPNGRDWYYAWTGPKGQSPKVGAIISWGRDSVEEDGGGHVAVIESINGDRATISQYNANSSKDFSTDIWVIGSSINSISRKPMYVRGYCYTGEWGGGGTHPVDHHATTDWQDDLVVPPGTRYEGIAETREVKSYWDYYSNSWIEK